MEIKVITVNQTEIKMSQYADDTTLILDGTKSSLSTALQTLSDFGEISGLRLNKGKLKHFG